MLVVGLDPGADGCAYALERSPTGVWEPGPFLRMPFYETGRKRPELDVQAVIAWVDGLVEVPALVAVEDVGYTPKTSALGGFTASVLSRRVGELIGMCKARKYAWEPVVSQSWQRACGVKVVRTKGESYRVRQKKIKAAVIAFCRQRYPHANLIPDGCRVPQDGLADAIGIAHWAAMQVTGHRD